jgi:ferritin-like protein
MSSTGLHEAAERLTRETIEMHRAIASLIEELEAVDWYAQRVDAAGDDALREVLAHNRDEEKEHACMTLEWIRRNDPCFAALLRKHLFASGSIVGREGAGHAAEEEPPDEPNLRIGSLRVAAS